MIKSLINKLALAAINIDDIYIEEKHKPHSVEILKHSKNYSKLLDFYVDSAKENITMKKWFKIIFFIVTILSLIAIVYLFFKTFVMRLTALINLTV